MILMDTVVTKVLQITSYPPPRAGWGMRVYFIKQEMEKNGDICEVLNIGKGRFLTGRDFVPVLGGLDYVKKVFRYRIKGYKIHMHLNGDSPKGFVLTILAEIISMLTFRRPIITFHAGPVQLYFPKFKAPLLTPMYKFIFHSAKYIICNNEEVKKNIMSYGIKGKKIFPIPSFSPQYLEFEPKELDSKIGKVFREKYPVIVNYVYFRPEFFIEGMIKCFRQFKQKYPNAYLIIIGHEEGSEEIKELIKNLGLEDLVYFVGDVDHDTFLTLLKKATLYLRTPVKDGVCSSVLEALALEIPVVASENGSRPEGVITYENGNIEDMVEKLSFVVENDAEIRGNLKRPDIEDTVAKEVELIKRA